MKRLTCYALAMAAGIASGTACKSPEKNAGATFKEAGDSSAATTSVAVRSISDSRAVVSTADADLVVNLDDLAAPDRAKLAAGLTSVDVVEVRIPPAAIAESRPTPFGMRADCSELPLSYERLKELITGSESLDAFLARLPPGTMQTFTLVYKSRSPMNGDVSPLWPRVLRMNRDGSLILAYTSDPSKPNYGRLEVLSFNEQTRAYTIAKADFRARGEARAIKENPSECMRCHAATVQSPDPKPIWDEYQTWTGVYGSEDDTYNTSAKYNPEPSGAYGEVDEPVIAAKQAERKLFDAFKAAPAFTQSVAFSTLPWARNDAASRAAIAGEIDAFKRRHNGKSPPADAWASNFALYPYSEGQKTLLYDVRPNLKFTEINARRMGQRMMRKLAALPQFSILKYVLYSEALGGACRNTALATDLRSLLPGYDKSVGAGEPGYHPYKRAPYAYTLAAYFGLSNAEWTMSATRPNDPAYHASIPKSVDAEFQIADALESELASLLVEDYPSYKGKLSFVAGSLDAFGPRFACLDKIAPGATFDAAVVSELCEKITADWHAKKSGLTPRVTPAPSDLSPRTTTAAEQGLGNDTAGTGRQLLAAHCVSCHGGVGETDRDLPPSLRFFANLTEGSVFRAALANDPALIDIAARRLNDELDPMPPSGRLDEASQTAITTFLRSLRSPSDP